MIISRPVKAMHCTKIGDVKNIQFKDKDGNEIARIETHYKQLGQLQTLDDNEEIIGIYGNTGSSYCFASLGFIVWKPPR